MPFVSPAPGIIQPTKADVRPWDKESILKLNKKKGFTLIELMIVIAIIAIIAAIAIPNLIEARKSGNEAAAIGALKTVASSQSLFREGDKEGDGEMDYGTLGELADESLIDTILGTGTKQGYTFSGSYSKTTSQFLWYCIANPALVGTTGDRYFATNNEGVTYFTNKETVVVNSTTCESPANIGMTPIGK